MKKVIVVLSALLLLGIVANAQETTQTKTKSPKINASGFAIDYHFEQDMIKLGADLCLGPIFLGGSFGKGLDNKPMQDVTRWDAHGGLRLRFPLIGNFFFVEGRAMGGYMATSFQKESTGFGYLGLTPRAEIDFGGLSITIGYRWDFAEFKFDDNHIHQYMTAGIGLGF